MLFVDDVRATFKYFSVAVFVILLRLLFFVFAFV